MIIYFLDNDPVKATQMLDDVSLNQQIRAIAQCLCNAHYLQSVYTPLGNGKTLSDLTKNIPLPLKNNDEGLSASHDGYSKWARTCKANYLKLVEMGRNACDEYWHRYKCEGCGGAGVSSCLGDGNPCRDCKGKDTKTHEYEDVIIWCSNNIPDLPCSPLIKIDAIKKEWAESMHTTFPLVMPKKYKSINNGIGLSGDVEETSIDIIGSYRNYYRAKIKEKMGDLVSNDNNPQNILSRKLQILGLNWTRREIPGFLKGVLSDK